MIVRKDEKDVFDAVRRVTGKHKFKSIIIINLNKT